MSGSNVRILFAYDGSECADAALDELRLAGLPDRADALVYSVAEVWLPTNEFADVVEHTFPGWFAPEVDAMRVLTDAAAERLRHAHPGWSVETEVEIGSAALRILRRAERWRPDLIITGARGRTGIGRLTIGSISQTVCAEALCSVRVGRGKHAEDEPVRLAICLDGSESSAAAVETVAGRSWPEEAEVLLLTALSAAGLPAAAADSARERVLELHRRAQERLSQAGLRITSAIEEGNPRQVLVEAAERWGAGCIFVGTRDVSFQVRSLLGSVSAATVMRAHCSVEVVRPKM